MKHTIVGIIAASLLLLPGALIAHDGSDHTAEEKALIEQINALLEIVASLQAQINALVDAEVTQPAKSEENPVFYRDLWVGSRGEDVRALQQALNKDPRTQITSAGIGSPGQESDFFGELTRRALIKFQTIYSSEVLAPAGISEANGYFGALTRAKIDSLTNTDFLADAHSDTSKEVSNDTSTPELDTDVDSETISSAPMITGISPAIGTLGTEVVVYGRGFTEENNTINLGFGLGSIENVPSENGITMRFVVNPDITIPDAPSGVFEQAIHMQVENENGVSFEPHMFVITN